LASLAFWWWILSDLRFGNTLNSFDPTQLVANRISSRRCLGASDPICVLVSRIITAADTQPPHLVLKSCSLKSEALSRPAFPGYPSGRVAQSIDNHAPLGFPER
jgi:hypothetical protein